MKQAQYGTGGADTDAIQEELDPEISFLHEDGYDLDLKEATLAAYEEAVHLAPEEAILHHHKAHALEQLGRIYEAEQSYEDARRLGYGG